MINNINEEIGGLKRQIGLAREQIGATKEQLEAREELGMLKERIRLGKSIYELMCRYNLPVEFKEDVYNLISQD